MELWSRWRLCGAELQATRRVISADNERAPDMEVSCEYLNKQSRTSSGGCPGCGGTEQLLNSVEFLRKPTNIRKTTLSKRATPL